MFKVCALGASITTIGALFCAFVPVVLKNDALPDTAINSVKGVQEMCSMQSNMDRLEKEIKLQINRNLYEKGLITEELYQRAKEQIIAGRGEMSTKPCRIPIDT